MTLTVFSTPDTDSRARGQALGGTWQAEIRSSWEGYQHLFASYEITPEVVHGVGFRTLEAVSDWAPDLAEEIVGIADAAGLEPWQAAALNARTEVLATYRPAARGECSTSVYLPQVGPPRTVQTWDWYAHLRHVKLIWQLRTDAGRTVKTFTEFGVLGKIGVNDTGLGVHFNLLQHHADGGEVGVPVHLVARRVLDRAATLEEAEAIVRSAPVSASTAITVVTHDDELGSEAATFELSPGGVGVLRAEAGGHLLHTNHFLDPALAAGERLAESDTDTLARQGELERRREALRAPDLAARAEALHLHEEDGAALCCHPLDGAAIGERWETLLLVGLDVGRGQLVCREGGPCTADADGWVRV